MQRGLEGGGGGQIERNDNSESCRGSYLGVHLVLQRMRRHCPRFVLFSSLLFFLHMKGLGKRTVCSHHHCCNPRGSGVVHYKGLRGHR